MSVADTISSIETNLSAAYTAAEEKGATIPEHKNIANLADTISSVSGGASEEVNDELNVLLLSYNNQLIRLLGTQNYDVASEPYQDDASAVIVNYKTSLETL